MNSILGVIENFLITFPRVDFPKCSLNSGYFYKIASYFPNCENCESDSMKYQMTSFLLLSYTKKTVQSCSRIIYSLRFFSFYKWRNKSIHPSKEFSFFNKILIWNLILKSKSFREALNLNYKCSTTLWIKKVSIMNSVCPLFVLSLWASDQSLE